MHFLSHTSDARGFTPPAHYHYKSDDILHPVSLRRQSLENSTPRSTPKSKRKSSDETFSLCRPRSHLQIPTFKLDDEQELAPLRSEKSKRGEFLEDGTDSVGGFSDISQHHDCAKEGCKRVVINVSGQRFETQQRTLERYAETLLGNPHKRKKYWDSSRKEYFFDRHRPTFQAILYYYQSGGRLKRPLEVPIDIFINELKFYELDVTVIDEYKRGEGFIVESHIPEMPRNRLQRQIWEMFEYPESSIAARILAGLSVIFILLSVVIFCVETLPQYQNMDCKNVSSFSFEGNGSVENITGLNDTVQWEVVPDFTAPLFIIESICITWFVFELIVRLSSSPSKVSFLKNIINWIDLLSILPYFILLGTLLVTDTCGEASKSGFLSVLRVLRVVRILKLSKHSEGLQILGKTMTTSISELTMFVLFLGIGIVIFSGAIYYAELAQSGSLFRSIPDAFWWAVVTMTTVGYGDVYPVGALGKIIGSCCVLSGLLAIALPVPVIVTNFNNFYRHSTGRGRSG